jgi:hypothetical protein
VHACHITSSTLDTAQCIVAVALLLAACMSPFALLCHIHVSCEPVRAGLTVVLLHLANRCVGLTCGLVCLRHASLWQYWL